MVYDTTQPSIPSLARPTCADPVPETARSGSSRSDASLSVSMSDQFLSTCPLRVHCPCLARGVPELRLAHAAGSGLIEGGKLAMIVFLAASSASPSIFSFGGSIGGWMMMRTPRGIASGTNAPGGW